MSNGIDGVSGYTPATAPAKSQASTDKVSGVSESAGSRADADVVQITGSANAIGKLQSQLSDAPPVDRARVDAIKTALAAGEYQPDPQRVADKFLEIERALGKV